MPLAERLADWRNAAARSMPTASSSPRVSRNGSQDFAPLEALQQLIGLFGRQAPLPLNVFPEAPGADREVAGQDRNAVLEDVDVGHLVADVHQPHDALHRVGIVDFERVVQREGVYVDHAG